jgi:hypothetical protein
MITLPIGRLAATGLLLTGIGAALPELPTSASTPDRTPVVSTPHLETPRVSTGPITTPSQTVHVAVAPVALPTSVHGDLGGLVSKRIATPAATPALAVTPEVPAVTVPSIDVASIAVEEVPVCVELPASATVADDGAHAWTQDLPAQLDVAEHGDRAAVRASGVQASIGLDG